MNRAVTRSGSPLITFLRIFQHLGRSRNGRSQRIQLLLRGFRVAIIYRFGDAWV